MPKLFINADPGSILIGRQRELCRTWPNQTEITVKGLHFLQEDSPDDIGRALADFVRQRPRLISSPRLHGERARACTGGGGGEGRLRSRELPWMLACGRDAC